MQSHTMPAHQSVPARRSFRDTRSRLALYASGSSPTSSSFVCTCLGSTNGSTCLAWHRIHQSARRRLYHLAAAATSRSYSLICLFLNHILFLFFYMQRFSFYGSVIGEAFFMRYLEFRLYEIVCGSWIPPFLLSWRIANEYLNRSGCCIV
ncbi:hypothetical protein F5Y04DRAFT_262469 [Hypomontagnella monticulosa]|nr:hypothetical protein F5Y04DRAFT_262469 [Hypomontagnella monticulosa]